jgi:ferredoxin-like protein FixX
MMSMDALRGHGFRIANFCDTSGNPSAAKVYRAAKIILAQRNIDAYFASGSGVASQEQYHSARGLVKAFREVRRKIPAVIRIGGNYEEDAMEILHNYTIDLPMRVEAYGRDTSATYCAGRLRELVAGWSYDDEEPYLPYDMEDPVSSHSFETLTGKIFVDGGRCTECKEKPCISACSAGILSLESGSPVLNISKEEARKGRCTECLACEIACQFHGQGAIVIRLPIHGLKEAVQEKE